jgi:hypothetical protein
LPHGLPFRKRHPFRSKSPPRITKKFCGAKLHGEASFLVRMQQQAEMIPFIEKEIKRRAM